MTRPPLRIRTHLIAALALTMAPFALAAPAGPADAASGAPNQPAPTVGRLTIHAVQGTPGGPKIALCDAEVDLRHQGSVIATRTVKLDDQGNGVVDDLPLGAGVIPVVKIRHADVYYLQSGPAMDATNADEEITVTCYEVTTQEPPWHVVVRHVMFVSDPHGLHITEVVQVHSDGERTWLGSTHAAGAMPITTSFSLPVQAANVQLGQGFNGWDDTSRFGDALYNHLPLMPGDSEMSLSYDIQSHESEVPLTFSAPVLTQNVMLIIPDNIAVTKMTNIQPGGGTRIADTDVHFYATQDLPPGAQVQISVAPASAQAGAGQPMASGAAPPSDSPGAGDTVKWVAAGAGAIVLLAAGALLLFRRGPGTA